MIIYKKKKTKKIPRANTILNGERLNEYLPPKPGGERQGGSLFPECGVYLHLFSSLNKFCNFQCANLLLISLNLFFGILFLMLFTEF